MLYFWMWPKFASDNDEVGADEFAALGQCDPVTVEQVHFLQKARQAKPKRSQQSFQDSMTSAA